MNDSTFDPFDLPSSFDPLGSGSVEPTGQSALSKPNRPLPRRRPAPPGDKSAAEPPAEIGAGNRLAHLIRPDRQRAPERGKSTTDPEVIAARLAALEDDLAILTARLDSLHTAVNERLVDQREKLVKAVAALLDERLGPRR